MSTTEINGGPWRGVRRTEQCLEHRLETEKKMSGNLTGKTQRPSRLPCGMNRYPILKTFCASLQYSEEDSC